MEVVSGDNWSYRTCKAPVKSSPPTNQSFHRPDALPVAQQRQSSEDVQDLQMFSNINFIRSLSWNLFLYTVIICFVFSIPRIGANLLYKFRIFAYMPVSVVQSL